MSRPLIDDRSKSKWTLPVITLWGAFHAILGPFSACPAVFRIEQGQRRHGSKRGVLVGRGIVMPTCCWGNNTAKRFGKHGEHRFNHFLAIGVLDLRFDALILHPFGVTPDHELRKVSENVLTCQTRYGFRGSRLATASQCKRKHRNQGARFTSEYPEMHKLRHLPSL
jgi:hypothetical protein